MTGEQSETPIQQRSKREVTASIAKSWYDSWMDEWQARTWYGKLRYPFWVLDRILQRLALLVFVVMLAGPALFIQGLNRLGSWYSSQTPAVYGESTKQQADTTQDNE